MSGYCNVAKGDIPSIYIPIHMLSIVLKSVLFFDNTHLKVPHRGVRQLTLSVPLFH